MSFSIQPRLVLEANETNNFSLKQRINSLPLKLERKREAV